jgi:predicted acylesterase/phospholipase RssA
VRSSGHGRRKVALVCAGGGVTGAVYEIGALRALEDLLDRSVLDFDLYVGVSGGAFVASLLAHGVSPREMYEQVASRAGSSFDASEASLFRLKLSDLLKSTRRAPRVLSQALMTSLTGEGRGALDLAFALFRMLPPGLLDNSGIQEYLAKVFKSRGKRDRFDGLSHPLYVVAVDLDAGEAVAFGEPGRRRLPVSKAVQASTAVPGLYRPVRIQGRDYVDGGVKKTAHINLAIRHGADLVVCINPIVPLLNDGARGPLDGRLSEQGVTWVLDQVFRIALHGRMQYGLERYKAEHPEVDILLVEPARKDMRMFSYDIMRLSARRVLVEDGYRSVLKTFRSQRAVYTRLLARHGIRLRDPASLPELPLLPPYDSRVARSLGVSLDLLESCLRRN